MPLLPCKFRYQSASQVRPVWPNLMTFLFLSQKALFWVGKVDINYCCFENVEVHKTSGDSKSRFAWSNTVQSRVMGLQLSFLALSGKFLLESREGQLFWIPLCRVSPNYLLCLFQHPNYSEILLNNKMCY